MRLLTGLFAKVAVVVAAIAVVDVVVDVAVVVPLWRRRRPPAVAASDIAAPGCRMADEPAPRRCWRSASAIATSWRWSGRRRRRRRLRDAEAQPDLRENWQEDSKRREKGVDR